MPAGRCTAKRFRHLLAVFCGTPSSAAMSQLSRPSEASRTIFARITSRVGVDFSRDHFVSVTRSGALNSITGARRIVPAVGRGNARQTA